MSTALFFIIILINFENTFNEKLYKIPHTYCSLVTNIYIPKIPNAIFCNKFNSWNDLNL